MTSVFKTVSLLAKPNYRMCYFQFDSTRFLKWNFKLENGINLQDCPATN